MKVSVNKAKLNTVVCELRQRQKRHLKSEFAKSISINLSNVGNFFSTWILKVCIEVQEKKSKVVVLRSRRRQIVKLGIFTS